MFEIVLQIQINVVSCYMYISVFLQSKYTKKDFHNSCGLYIDRCWDSTWVWRALIWLLKLTVRLLVEGGTRFDMIELVFWFTSNMLFTDRRQMSIADKLCLNLQRENRIMSEINLYWFMQIREKTISCQEKNLYWYTQIIFT